MEIRVALNINFIKLGIRYVSLKIPLQSVERSKENNQTIPISYRIRSIGRCEENSKARESREVETITAAVAILTEQRSQRERSFVSWTVNVGLPFSTEIQLRYK